MMPVNDVIPYCRTLATPYVQNEPIAHNVIKQKCKVMHRIELPLNAALDFCDFCAQWSNGPRFGGASFGIFWPNGPRFGGASFGIFWPNGPRFGGASFGIFWPNGLRFGGASFGIFWPNGAMHGKRWAGYNLKDGPCITCANVHRPNSRSQQPSTQPRR